MRKIKCSWYLLLALNHDLSDIHYLNVTEAHRLLLHSYSGNNILGSIFKLRELGFNEVK